MVAQCCKAVIACRARKDQKAKLTRLVRNGNREVVTLAIGDGANDVEMIRTAHIGVGVIGKEGTQAVNNADYAIGQFRFLTRLLLVYGHRNYRGITLAALLIFMQMSVFSAEIPWGYWLGIVKNAPETAFFVRPLAVVIFCAATWLLYKGRISIMSVIFGSAAVGALGAAAGLS